MRISNSSVVALDELWTVSDSSGDQVSLLDTIQDPQAADPAQEMDTTEMKDRLADAIARLPEREKLVVALYYYENLTLREIGEVLGVTESRVSQLHTKAVLRLKSRLQGDSAGRRRVGEPQLLRRSHRYGDELATRARQQAAVAELGQRALAGLDLDELVAEAAAVGRARARDGVRLGARADRRRARPRGARRPWAARRRHRRRAVACGADELHRLRAARARAR